MQTTEAFQLHETIKITLKLFATFREGRFSVASREYATGTKIADIIRELRLPEAQLGTIMLNSRHAEPEKELKDGDILAIFPLVGGG